MSTIQHEEQTVDSADGTTLYIQSWLPAKGKLPKAHLVMCHGYLEHCGRYQEVSKYMAGQGDIASTVFDFRGHGQSAGTQGYVGKFTEFHDDIKTVLATVIAKTPDDSPTVPLFLLGHSNGGLAVLDSLLSDPTFFAKSIQGVIITSPFLAPANEISYFKVIISRILGYWFPKLALPANEVTSAILTHDDIKRQEHQSDPYVQSKFTLGWAVQGMGAQKRVIQQLHHCPVPVLFVYAQDDQVANPTVNQTFAATMIAHADKTIVERVGEYHEVLNEIKRIETFALIKDWILQRSSK